jgi:hypothetical protein
VRAPLWCHAGVLLVVLLALLPLARTDTVFFADEGSALAQARQLADGDGWTRPLSFPAADPDASTFPLLNGAVAEGRLAPLGLHPVYAMALEPWYAVGGRGGAVLLSLAGLVIAAVLAARIARRLRSGLEVPALWATGVASPLFFDGYLVAAHTLAAALAAGVALAVVRFVARERRALMLAVATVLATCAGLLRNEAVLYALAFGAVALVAGIRGRDRGLAALGVAIGSTAAVVRVAETVIRAKVLGVGRLNQFTVLTESGGWISHHVQGAFITLLLPSYGQFDVGDVLLVLGITCAITAGVIVRRRPEDRSGLLLFSGLAVGLLVVRLAVTAGPVPGLLWACPLVGVAAALCTRRVLTRRPVGLLAAAVALFAVGVVLTQYSAGGGREWGWRYVALALPIVMPIALLVIVEASARIEARDRVVVARLLVALCAAVSVLAFLALRETRADNRAIVDGIRAAYEATPAADGGKPVVVTTQWGTIDRFNWDHVDETRWLVIAPTDRSQVAVYLDRIARLGVGQVTFVTTNIDDDLQYVVARGVVVAEHSLPHDHKVLTVRLNPP